VPELIDELVGHDDLPVELGSAFGGVLKKFRQASPSLSGALRRDLVAQGLDVAHGRTHLLEG
jgi:hypothetical protein